MGALRVEKLQFSGKMSAFKQVESMRLAEEEARLKAKEEERLKAVEAKRVSDEKAAMAALLAEADATKKLLAEEKATTAALEAAAEREHARAALLEEMEAAEKRLAEEKARRAKVMLEVMLKAMLNRKLSIAFNEWQATAAQTKAEVEVELQEAIQKAVWPCGEVLVHEEDKLRAAEWGRRAKAEPWLHRMTKETCIQTSGGTPPVSGKPRRSQWFLLFSCIALVCCVVLMVMLMPVMSEDAHVEKPKNFQDIESASPQDIEEAMNQLKEETRAEEAIKDQKARILKEENERAAKLGPILQKQKQDYAKKKGAVDAQEKLPKRHAKNTEEVDANVEQHFSEIDNKAAKAKESKIKTAEKTAKTAVLDINELKAKNAAKEAKVKKAAKERVAKEKMAKKTAKTAVLDIKELKVKKAAKEAKFKIAADERRQKNQGQLDDKGYGGCETPQDATPEQLAASNADKEKKAKEQLEANAAKNWDTAMTVVEGVGTFTLLHVPGINVVTVITQAYRYQPWRYLM